MSPPSPPSPPPKKKTKRRAGSCEPCRKSKIKCDGKVPECTACSRRKRSKPKEACVYIPIKARSKAALPEQANDTDSGDRGRSSLSPLSTIEEDSDDSDSPPPSPYPFKGPPAAYQRDEEFFGPHGFARCINKFKTISTDSNDPSISDAVARCNGIEAFDIIAPGGMLEPSELSASRNKHTLSHFLPSTDLHVMPPEIQQMGWKAINMKERLLDNGRVIEAYKDLAGLAREALLFRRLNTKQKTKTPKTNPLQEEVEKKIYRLIVDMDIRICMHIGTPLEVQPEKIPASVTFTASDASPSLQELEKSQSTFRQLAFEVLTLFPKITTNCDNTTIKKHMSDLIVHFDTLESQCFVTPAAEPGSEAKFLFTEHWIERLALLMLLSCSLGDLSQCAGIDNEQSDKSSAQIKKRKSKPNRSSTEYAQSALKAAQKILHLFTDIGEPKGGWTWTCAYACFCATAITSIAIVNGDSKTIDVEHVKQAVDYFRKGTRQQPNEFYGLAYAQLDKLWAKVKLVTEQRAPATKSRQATLKRSPSGMSETEALQSSPTGRRRKRPTDVDDGEDVKITNKRLRSSPTSASSSLPMAALNYQAMTSSHPYNSGQPPAFYPWDTGYDTSVPTSANTSFGGGLPMGATYEITGHSWNHDMWHRWYNPPEAHPLPPLKPLDYWERMPQTAEEFSGMPTTDGYPLQYGSAAPTAYNTQYTGPVAAHTHTPVAGGLPYSAANQAAWIDGRSAVAHGIPQCYIPEASRRRSVVSQEDNHLTQVWEADPRHDTADDSDIPQSSTAQQPQYFGATYAGRMNYGNETMTVTNWSGPEQYHFNSDGASAASEWQDQRHFLATTVS